jgi:hypothetical protein
VRRLKTLQALQSRVARLPLVYVVGGPLEDLVLVGEAPSGSVHVICSQANVRGLLIGEDAAKGREAITQTLHTVQSRSAAARHANAGNLQMVAVAVSSGLAVTSGMCSRQRKQSKRWKAR